MTSEQRKHPRITKFLEATWSPASGESVCRISDLGWGGCFVQARAEPTIGEHTTLTFNVEGIPVTVNGTIRTVERGIGFSLQFEELSPVQIEALRALLGQEGP